MRHCPFCGLLGHTTTADGIVTCGCGASAPFEAWQAMRPEEHQTITRLSRHLDFMTIEWYKHRDELRHMNAALRRKNKRLKRNKEAGRDDH